MSTQETKPQQTPPETQPSVPVPEKRTSPQHGVEQEGAQTTSQQSSNAQMLHGDRLRRQWPDFSDEDLRAITANSDELKPRLKRVYGFTEERAEKEYKTFIKPYESSFEPTH